MLSITNQPNGHDELPLWLLRMCATQSAASRLGLLLLACKQPLSRLHHTECSCNLTTQLHTTPLAACTAMSSDNLTHNSTPRDNMTAVPAPAMGQSPAVQTHCPCHQLSQLVGSRNGPCQLLMYWHGPGRRLSWGTGGCVILSTAHTHARPCTSAKGALC